MWMGPEVPQSNLHQGFSSETPETGRISGKNFVAGEDRNWKLSIYPEFRQFFESMMKYRLSRLVRYAIVP